MQTFREMLYIWRICIFILWLAGSFTAVLGEDEVTVVALNRDVPAAHLVCWTCLHNQDTPDKNCITMNNKTKVTKTKCPLHQAFCRIRKLTDGSGVNFLERKCTDDCTHGCHQINKLDSCEWCCTQPLCNIGNRAPCTTRSDAMYTLCMVIFVVILRISN